MDTPRPDTGRTARSRVVVRRSTVTVVGVTVMGSIVAVLSLMAPAVDLSPRTVWYSSRVAGVAALVLLTATVLLGILTAARIRPLLLPHRVVRELHRNLSLTAVAFIAVHVGTAVSNTYIDIRLRDIFLPFAARVHPTWIGLGAVAVDLLLAIGFTTALRWHLLPRTSTRRRVWRAIHLAAYVIWPVTLRHALAGSPPPDGPGWTAAICAACVLCVGTAALLAVLHSRRRSPGRRQRHDPSRIPPAEEVHS